MKLREKHAVGPEIRDDMSCSLCIVFCEASAWYGSELTRLKYS